MGDILKMDTDLIYDLCIVGAGMFGSAAARHASANPRVKVCLIGPVEPTVEERKHREIFSSHYDEGRIVQTVDEINPLYILSKQSISRYNELQKLSGIRFYSPLGSLMVAEKDSYDMIELVNSCHNNDIPFVDLSDDETFKKRFPYLQLDECVSRIFDDNGAGLINARMFIEAQKKVATIQGCHIVEDVVEEVKDLEQGMHMVIGEKGIIRARRILICTGAFTNYKKFHPLKELNMIVNKETVAMPRISEASARIISSMPPMLYLKNNEDEELSMGGYYILPPVKYPDGGHYLKIGRLGLLHDCPNPTLPEIKEWYNCIGDPEQISEMSTILKKLLPCIEFEEISSKTCLTCHNETCLPYIDRITPTFSIAVVGNGVGASISDEVGRIAAELSISGKWDSSLPKSIFQAIFK
ncbi:peroxisomal sarcosine oxidase [Nephila pilipes]|uniref:Peroxisomal sarcosine oxidase n=1 Tax=Nephila pilipes TaxID=299642 RepID=A0A8X6NS74_NEPPI|nr:peroxisomal sarcosine oxidase [Nephila pilipes]